MNDNLHKHRKVSDENRYVYEILLQFMDSVFTLSYLKQLGKSTNTHELQKDICCMFHCQTCTVTLSCV